MINCKICHESKTCNDCFSIIDGVVLQRKMAVPRKVLLETKDGEACEGELFVVSPVGLGIKAEILPSNDYEIKFSANLKLKLKKIINRGKNGYYGFDIVEVNRAGSSSVRLNNEEYMALTLSCEKLVEDITESLPENVREIVQERLKAELDKARILDAIKVGQAYKYQQGEIKKLSNYLDIEGHEKQMRELIDRCSRTGIPVREILVDEKNKIYDMHVIPFDYQSGGILILDSTVIVERERELKEKEMFIYKEAISAVTGGKLQLVDKSQAATYGALGQAVLEETFSQPTDLDILRLKIEEIIGKLKVEEKMTFLICVSEALTNAIKHAYGGICKVNVSQDGIIRVEVTDNGPGIPFKDLSKAALMNGFSTINSLGCGFTIMLKFADKVILSTDSNGTTVVLEKIVKEN